MAGRGGFFDTSRDAVLEALALAIILALLFLAFAWPALTGFPGLAAMDGETARNPPRDPAATIHASPGFTVQQGTANERR